MNGQQEAAEAEDLQHEIGPFGAEGPSRLCVRARPVAVFHEGSAGEYEIRLSQTASPSRSNRNPTASLRRVWREGERNVIRLCGRKARAITIMPKITRYHTNTAKLWRRRYCRKNAMTTIPTSPLTMMPAIQGSRISAGNPPSLCRSQSIFERAAGDDGRG